MGDSFDLLEMCIAERDELYHRIACFFLLPLTTKRYRMTSSDTNIDKVRGTLLHSFDQINPESRENSTYQTPLFQSGLNVEVLQEFIHSTKCTAGLVGGQQIE